MELGFFLYGDLYVKYVQKYVPKLWKAQIICLLECEDYFLVGMHMLLVEKLLEKLLGLWVLFGNNFGKLFAMPMLWVAWESCLKCTEVGWIVWKFGWNAHKFVGMLERE